MKYVKKRKSCRSTLLNLKPAIQLALHHWARLEITGKCIEWMSSFPLLVSIKSATSQINVKI